MQEHIDYQEEERAIHSRCNHINANIETIYSHLCNARKQRDEKNSSQVQAPSKTQNNFHNSN